MQAAGMLRCTRAVYLLVFLIPLIGYAHAHPIQILPSIPGFIPVYIRHGDEPLEQINPALADAFHEGPSVSKSIQLNDIPDPTDINLEEDDSLVGDSEKKDIYAVHVRQADSSAYNSDKNRGARKPTTERNVDAKTPKLLTIYELPDDRRRGHRGKSRRMPVPVDAPVKVSPPSGDLGTLVKLSIPIAKEESGTNNLDESKTSSETSLRTQHRQNKMPNIGATGKVRPDAITPPGPRQITDLSDRGTATPDEVDLRTDQEPPVKLQPPPGIFLNVHKISPLEGSEGNDNSRQDNKSNDPTEGNDAMTN